MDIFTDEYFMKIAFQEALKAYEEDEVPVGAVIISQNKILAKAHNLTETLIDVTAHAEIQAITSASNYLQSKYLHDCTMYVTLEPCSMCAGALYWSQISRLVIGASDPKRGFITTGVNLHPTTELVGGVLEEECSQLLKDFFKDKR